MSSSRKSKKVFIDVSGMREDRFFVYTTTVEINNLFLVRDENNKLVLVNGGSELGPTNPDERPTAYYKTHREAVQAIKSFFKERVDIVKYS